MANFRKGDINMDGVINQADLDLINAHINETSLLTGEALELADIDGDGKANIKDMNRITAIIEEEGRIFGYKANGTKIEVTTKEEFDALVASFDSVVAEALTGIEADLSTAQSNISQLNTKTTGLETTTNTLNTNLTSLTSTVNTLSTNTTNSLNGKQKTISKGTSSPSGGSNGDIYIQYF